MGKRLIGTTLVVVMLFSGTPLLAAPVPVHKRAHNLTQVERARYAEMERRAMSEEAEAFDEPGAESTTWEDVEIAAAVLLYLAVAGGLAFLTLSAF